MNICFQCLNTVRCKYNEVSSLLVDFLKTCKLCDIIQNIPHWASRPSWQSVWVCDVNRLGLMLQCKKWLILLSSFVLFLVKT